jgi:hypothetical protein
MLRAGYRRPPGPNASSFTEGQELDHIVPRQHAGADEDDPERDSQGRDDH